jgi:hypothetical protein
VPSGIHCIPSGYKKMSLECAPSLQRPDGSLIHGSPVCDEDRLHFDGNFVDRSGKRCRHLVFLGYRCCEILTNIRPFIPREHEGLGSRDPAFGKLGAAQKNPPDATCSWLPAGIGEIEP